MDQERVDKIVLEHLQSTVLRLGSISIQNLTGHFSQLPNDIRKKFNCTKAEVKKFLLAYPDVFIVNDEMVSISQKRDPLNLVDTSVQCEIPTMINNGNDSNDDEEAVEKEQNLILDCKGKILRLFDVYGFIEYSGPDNSTTSIYFDALCFEDGRYENLYKLKVDDEVNFCAKQSVGQHKAKYRATKVWRTGYSISLQGSERCYSSNTSLASQDSYQSEVLNGVGKLVKITTNYGFIKPAGKAQRNVFFFRTKVQIPDMEEISNLEDVLKVGDILYFSAIQSRKKNADAPWEAVKVSIIPLENLCNVSSKHYNKNSSIHTGSTSSTDGSYQSLSLDIDAINDENHIYNENGTIHQLAGSEPVIHFGKDEKALVPSNVVYKNNKLIEDFGWEIDEGTEVTFNAEYDGTHWKAVLVWIGDKPQLSNRKSHNKKRIQVKQSVVSDLCPISLYDDQSDDGIWHTSSSHIDTGTWDDENNENWPALEPPVSARSRQAEKIKLSKFENNPEALRSDRINTVPNDYNEKFNSEANISDYATALSGDSQEVVNASNSKKNRKKKSISDINASFAKVLTSHSKEFQKNKNDSSSNEERIQRYKMNNGWEEESFNTNGEKWPALNEPPESSRLISSTSKTSFHRSKEKLSGWVTENQSANQQLMPNMFNYTGFISQKNGMQESYYSDSDEFHDQEIASGITHEDLSLNNSQSFTKVSKTVKEISYSKFSDVMGTVVNVQQYSGFIKSEKLHQNLFFCWEQAFCNGRLVSKHYTNLGKAFNEFDNVSFTYCQMIDENGKEWISLLQVWKGKKPMETTRDVQQTSENRNLVQKEISPFIDTSLAGINVLNKSKKISLISPEVTLATTGNGAINKNSTEDSGICIEELEKCEYKDSETTNGLSSCSSSSALNTLAVCQKEKEVETAMKYSDLSSINYASVNQLKTTDGSHVENNMKCTAVSFLNHLHGLSHSLRPESVSSKELLPRTVTDSTQASVKSQETQTELATCDEGIQTFITGTILSIEVFPH